MVWVEARAFGVPLAAIAAVAAFMIVSSKFHAQAAGTVVFALVILATVFIGGNVWSHGLDRGRKPRYAPIVFNTVGIGCGSLAVIFQLWNLAAMQHSRHDAMALLAGAVTAVVFTVLVLRNVGRSARLLRAARSRSAEGRTRDTLRA